MIWIFAAFVVLYGNALQPMVGATAWLPGGSWSFVIAGAMLVLVCVAGANSFGLRVTDVGLRRDTALAGFLVGAIAGAAVAIVGVVALRLVAPAIVGREIDYAPLRSVTSVDLERHLLLFLPLSDIAPEELAFRGVLLGALLRRMNTRNAVLISAAAYALWHVAVAVVTVGDTTLGPPSAWFLPATVAALLAVFAGGLAFAWLRLATRSLTASLAAHWVFNSVVLVGLWATMGPLVPAR
jgi:membrane protease YdiL (CAAX protease family)